MEQLNIGKEHIYGEQNTYIPYRKEEVVALRMFVRWALEQAPEAIDSYIDERKDFINSILKN